MLRGLSTAGALGLALAALPTGADAACARTWAAPADPANLPLMIQGAPDNTCITLAANTVYAMGDATKHTVTLKGQGQESTVLVGDSVQLAYGGQVILEDLTVVGSNKGSQHYAVFITNGTLAARRCLFRDNFSVRALPAPVTPHSCSFVARCPPPAPPPQPRSHCPVAQPLLRHAV